MPSGAGAQPFFPPRARVPIEHRAGTDPAAEGGHLARWDCRRWPPVVVEPAVVDAIHATTGARIVATARLQPHRRRDGKTATIDERCVTQAATMVWRDDRGAVVRGGFPPNRGAAGRALAGRSKTSATGR
jgi:hypothetical protein